MHHLVSYHIQCYFIYLLIYFFWFSVFKAFLVKDRLAQGPSSFVKDVSLTFLCFDSSDELYREQNVQENCKFVQSCPD